MLKQTLLFSVDSTTKCETNFKSEQKYHGKYKIPVQKVYFYHQT